MATYQGLKVIIQKTQKVKTQNLVTEKKRKTLITYLNVTEILYGFGDFLEMLVTDVEGNGSDDSIALFFFS